MTLTQKNLTTILSVPTALMLSTAIHAESSSRHIQIPAGQLSTALNRLAEASDLQMVYDADITKYIKNQSIIGNYTPTQALQRLLQGSGLGYQLADNGTVTISRQTPSAPPQNSNISPEAAVLPTVRVKSQAEYFTDDPENTRYNRTEASTATKTDTPLMETPASIQVVPQQVLKDQQAVTLTDALKNVSGVQLSFSPTYENFTVRGFDLNGATYRNGIREASWAAETANVERLEVLKGPGAMLYGRIEPGGMVNRVTKKPLDTAYYSAQQQFGSFDFYRTTADATGPINDSGTLTYRFNLAYQNNKSYRDLFFRDRIFLAPQLNWKISDRTEVGIGMEYQRDDFRWDDGFPVLDGANRPANLPINRALNDPLANANQERNVVDLNWSHAFNDDWKISQQFSSFLGGRHQFDIFPYGFHADQRTVDRYNWDNTVDSNTYSFNTNLLGHLNTWNVKHTVLVGHDYYQLTDQAKGRCCAFVDSIDIYNPQYFTGSITPVPPNYGFYQQEWNGAYFQDQMVFWDRLHVLGGGRYDWATYGVGSSSVSFSSAEKQLNANQVNAEKFSPRVGVLYQAWPWLSVYGNYTESLGGSNSYSGRNADGKPLQPQLANQYEAGIKTEFFDKRLTASLAYFEVTKSNVAAGNPDPALAMQGYAVTIGEAQSRGVEFDIAGQLTDNLNVIANYAYLDTEITKFTASDVWGGVSLLGKRFPNAPEHSANIWAKYDFTDYGLKGLGLGTGVRVVSLRQGDPQNSFQLPGYTTWDALLSYQLKVGKSKVTTQFNVYNLLDERYFSSADTFDASQRYYGNIPGAPRNFMGSVRLEF
ncbi:TonB-dependent siderophore receptor [Methylovulum miyakonense]|uniref:TonB-dependent siderophore receptor n=1 Tax=Methylovulum miyakonense TaxID=645578 RepID=UPI0003689F4A|nr:TonB-dependent receptor [Methylovulum miyakonense]